jgi:uncharacterized OB-fold protein
MKTARAKRLEKFLSDHGWGTGTGTYKCKKCGKIYYDRPNFCGECGAPMPTKQEHGDTFDQLEEAIAYALKEKP